jgi:hypothetical protein
LSRGRDVEFITDNKNDRRRVCGVTWSSSCTGRPACCGVVVTNGDIACTLKRALDRGAKAGVGVNGDVTAEDNVLMSVGIPCLSIAWPLDVGPSSDEKVGSRVLGDLSPSIRGPNWSCLLSLSDRSLCDAGRSCSCTSPCERPWPSSMTISSMSSRVGSSTEPECEPLTERCSGRPGVFWNGEVGFDNGKGIEWVLCGVELVVEETDDVVRDKDGVRVRDTGLRYEMLRNLSYAVGCNVIE